MSTDDIRQACDEIDDRIETDRATIASLGSRVAQLERDLVVANQKIEDLEWRPILQDSLNTIPQPKTRWNVDAPQSSLLLVKDPTDLGLVLQTQIRRDQPLNPQGRCKTELGPRDQQKTTESYERLPTNTPIRMDIDCCVPLNWRRYPHKFPLWGFHGDTAAGQRGPFSAGIVGDRLYLWVWDAERGPTDLTLNGKPGWPRWAGWKKMRVDAVLSEDPAEGVSRFTLEGYPAVDVKGTNVVGLPYFKFGIYAPSWSVPERDSIDFADEPPFTQAVRWRNFKLSVRR